VRRKVTVTVDHRKAAFNRKMVLENGSATLKAGYIVQTPQFY